MHARRILIATMAGLACTASATAGAAQTSARKQPIRYDRGIVRVIQPTMFQPFFGSLHVVLAVKRGAHIDLAEIGGRSFKRLLKKTSPTRYVAQIPRRLIGTGPRALRITATSANGRLRDRDLLPLLAAVRKSSVLTVRARRVGRSTSAADITAVTHPARAALRVWLNGHRLDTRMRPGGVGVRVLRVTAADGLRFGRNTIVATAHDGRRFADRETHLLIEPRTAPLAGVSFTRRVRSHGIEWLNAAKTLPVHRGDRLSYRWSVVSAPRGARPRLITHRGVRVRLVPDKAGYYRVRLTVSERVPRTRNQVRATRSIAGGGRLARDAQAGGNVVTGSVTLEVAATVPVSPFGIQISTTTSGSGAGIDYVGQLSIHAPGDGGITAMTIDTVTGVPTAGQIPGINGAPDIQTLATDIQGQAGPLAPPKAPGESNLIVLTGELSASSPLNDNANAITALQNALQFIGVDPNESQADAHVIASGQPFSVIGFPTETPGSAYANFDSSADDAGGLTGYIRDTGRLLGNSTALTFQPGQLFPFTAGTKGAQINGPSGQVNISPPPAGAFSVSVLDAHSLRLIGTVTSGTGPNQSVGSIGNVSTPLGFVDRYVRDPTKLFLLLWNGYVANYSDRSNLYHLLGDPSNSDNSPTSPGLTSIGVNRDLLVRSFQAPDPSESYETNVFFNHEYTFLGGAGVTSVDASPLKLLDSGIPGDCPKNQPGMSNPQTGQQCVSISGPNIVGFLSEDQHGRFEPRAATASGNPGVESSVTQLAQQAATPYAYPTSPVGTTAQYAAAEAHLYDTINASYPYCHGATSDCDIVAEAIRANYGAPDFYDAITNVTTALSCPLLGKSAPMPSSLYNNSSQFSEQQLAALWAQVCTEVQEIQNIHQDTFTPLHDALTNAQLQAPLNLTQESSLFQSFLNSNTHVPGLNVVDLISRITEFVGVVADLAGEEEIGEPLAFVASGLGIGAEFNDQPKSNDTNMKLEATVGDIAGWITDTFNSTSTTLDELEGILYSDPTKLAAAYQEISQGNAPWNLSAGESHIITNGLVYAQANYVYPRLLAAANPNSCTKINDPDVFSPNFKQPGPSSDPLTYLAETNPIEAVDSNDNGIPYALSAYLQAVKLSSSNAKTLAGILFQGPTKAELNSDQLPPGNQPPFGGLARPDLALTLQDASNSLNCQAPLSWVQNGK